MSRIAIVGLACRYPDADSPEQLWTNVVAGRRAFRQLPDERMRLDDYWSPDPAAPDRFYARHAAVIEGYEFDRVGHRVAGSTYRSTDLTHWLAVDVATEALADAGFPDGDELPRERTAVVIGNSLTGEFARANLMRLRWPYVRRTVAAGLLEQGWDDDRVDEFLAVLEQRYKEPFPPIDEDSLAGGLSNTIAGRICNLFDLKGGGYTVDGACSSSLLSVATACRSLRDHEVDVAIAGGVDLSIDPFEIVGFAKTGALATGEMKVYDRRSTGFWPGEGCGMVVLMREPEALAAGHRSYATIVGAGISSDGKGGITRPEIAGYKLAVRRAYRNAGFDVDSVGLFEGHGTGTPVGNDTELKALAAARRSADPAAPPAAIGSIKAMIGHTKAAAGVAGLIKATLAVHHEILPPTVGCHEPHPVLCEEPPALRVLETAEPWPEHASGVRAAVTAMGFGGINTHLVLENAQPRRRASLDPTVAALSRFAANDAELLVVDADDADVCHERVDELASFVERLSYAELGDLAASLQRETADRPYRAAVVARSPQQAAERLRRLADVLGSGTAAVWQPDDGIFAGRAEHRPRIGFLFPGQGSGDRPAGGAIRRRFADADHVYTRAALPSGGDLVATAAAQPRITTGAVAGLAVLRAFGIDGSVAVGHSLGELTALCWSGSIDQDALLRIAEVRGRVMTTHSQPGTMASISAPPEAVESLLPETGVVIAGYNGPRQTVVAGAEAGIRQVCDRAAGAGFGWALLPVSHAFHSPLVQPSATQFAAHLASETFGPVARPVVSTVTGQHLDSGADIAALLERQITEPVRFTSALTAAAAEVDLFIEVGPGAVLSRLAAEISDVPAVATDTDGASLAPMWAAVGAAFVAGVPVRFDAALAGRPDRSLDVGTELRFFASPCEAAPDIAAGAAGTAAVAELTATAPDSGVDTVDLVRELVATRAELPGETIHEDSRLLDDLHLSSITVGQVFAQAARNLGIPPGQAPTTFATATLKELAVALDELRTTAVDGDSAEPDQVAGIDTWVRPFRIDLVPAAPPAPVSQEPAGGWRVYDGVEHPLAEPLRRALERGSVGGGVLVCLPTDCGEADLEPALLAAKAALAQEPGGRFVVVQHGRGATAIAKTARLEAPHLRTTVIDTPPVAEAVPGIIADVAATTGYREVHYDADGERRTPVLRPVTPGPAGQPPLDSDDVLLVTGGGKGITAECALGLAADSSARLAILGRSDPAADDELAANLERMRSAGITVRYAAADVTDPAAVAAAVADLTTALGPVTAVLHGAGSNEPAAITGLDMAAFRRAIAPKLDGLDAVLAAVDPATLKLVVTFGSIIGRAGLRGEAHYATANDWLAEATEAIGRRHPHCRAICLEWSVWAGAGMGERLSVVQSLMREGISPIPVERGVETLRQLLADPTLPPVLVVTGRAEGVDTISYERQPLPLLRFVERPLVHYPQVELVVETRLAAGSDPYLDDHLLDGNLLFPAVLGMEAMAQVSVALRERAGRPVFSQMEFRRPIVVPPGGQTVIRIAALATGPGTVQVAIRSEETDFGVDHFRATLQYDQPPLPSEPAELGDDRRVALDPERDLYGGVLFQGGRFRRLVGYRAVAARHAEADVAVGGADWFATYLPGEMLLGDPGARDAFMHGIQVCVPHATLLPSGVDRLHPGVGAGADVGEVTFTASERSQDGDSYTYDIVVRSSSGDVIERWDGLRLRAVRKGEGPGSWPPPLVGPYLQRRLAELCDLPVTVAVAPDDAAGRRAGTAAALRHILGPAVTLRYRPDGRPEIDGDRHVSSSHGAGATLTVVAVTPVGCDMEPVVPRSDVEWADLLGAQRALVPLLRQATEDDRDAAATRIWCAMEAWQKSGGALDTPLVLDGHPAPGWTVLRAGRSRIATTVTRLDSATEPVVVAVAVREET
jgi:enediyne polyketide synthase